MTTPNLFNKDNKTEDNPVYTKIEGMILLEDPASFAVNAFINELQKKWHLNIDNQELNAKNLALIIDNFIIKIVVVPNKIPNVQVENTVKYNYLWNNRLEETAKHKGHIILSINNVGINPLKENLLFSMLASSIMNNSKSLGIYIAKRGLVLKKEFYQTSVDMMPDQNIPLLIWFYFGLRNENGMLSMYTIGLTDFGKKDMEIISPNYSQAELTEMIFSLTSYVVTNNVNLENDPEQNLKITETQDKYFGGTILKIEL